VHAIMFIGLLLQSSTFSELWSWWWWWWLLLAVI
jgi:hypothetical protein